MSCRRISESVLDDHNKDSFTAIEYVLGCVFHERPCNYSHWMAFLLKGRSCIFQSSNPPPLVKHCEYDEPISPGFPYGSEKVRGVNLGGWLILMPWITPSIFDNTGNDSIIDEWTFCKYQDRENATAVLQHHWDTFITDADFAAVAAAGLNHVRVPIGYWAFDLQEGEPYIQGQLPYLHKAVSWAEKYGLKVIIDLYGAPGSQNGFVKSGQIKATPEWHKASTNVQRTHSVIKQIATLFAANTSVVPIIAPMNEPAGWYPELIYTLRSYWADTYEHIRFPFNNSRQQSNSVVLMHDAFQPLNYWRDFFRAPYFQGVAMDTTIYFPFSGDLALSDDGRIREACRRAYELENFHLWTIVGAWAPARTDCAKYLNGRGLGSRYDGTFPNSTFIGNCSGLSGSADTFSGEYKNFLARFWEAQTTAYEANAGWIQWVWKSEEGAGEEWSYSKGIEHGWIPQNASERRYPDSCG